MNEEDRSRLEAFRQFRKEVRGSKEYLLVGIDVAKEKHHAFFGTATGKTLLRRLVFENNLAGFERLLDQVRALQVRQGPPCSGCGSRFRRRGGWSNRSAFRLASSRGEFRPHRVYPATSCRTSPPG